MWLLNSGDLMGRFQCICYFRVFPLRFLVLNKFVLWVSVTVLKSLAQFAWPELILHVQGKKIGWLEHGCLWMYLNELCCYQLSWNHLVIISNCPCKVTMWYFKTENVFRHHLAHDQRGFKVSFALKRLTDPNILVWWISINQLHFYKFFTSHFISS